MIQIDAVSLVSIFVECVLYGISVVLYAIAMLVLFRRRSTNGLNKPMLCAIAFMFILGTIHVSVDLRRLMIAFLHSSAGPNKYLAEINTVLYVVRSTAYVMQTLLGDGFVLWRVFLVWNGDKRACYPLLVAFLFDVGIGIGALHSVAAASSNSPIFDSKKWVASFYSMTLFTNLAGSSLLAWRIWWISRHINSSRMTTSTSSDQRVTTAAIIVVESGLIYSVVLSAQLTLYLCNTFAQYILIDAACQIVGIVFSLIIVRVGLGLTSDAARATEIHTAPSFLHSVGTRASRRNPIETYPMDPVQVHISKVTHDDDGITLEPNTFPASSKGDEKRSVRSLSAGDGIAV